jgi:O-antigen/teichoic acid export membrane protein
LAARLATTVLGLSLLVLVAREGPELQGAFALLLAIEAVLLALGSGAGLLLAREAAQAGQLPRQRVLHLLGRLTLLAVGVSVALAFWSSQAVAVPYTHLWMLALALPLLLVAPTMAALWMGQGRLVALNAPPLSSAGLALLAIGCLLLRDSAQAEQQRLPSVIALWLGVRCVVALGCLWAAARRPSAPPAASWNATADGQVWRFMAVIALANGVSLLNYRATLFMVERFHGIAAAGIYSVAVQIAELLWMLSGALTVAAYHRIGAAPARESALLAAHAARQGVLLTALAAPLLGLLDWGALPWVMGAAYSDSWLPLLCLLPGVAAYAAASGLSAFFTHHGGRPQWAAGVAALSLLVNTAVGFVLVPRWGAVGAALASSLGYILAIGVGLWLFRRHTGLPGKALWRSDNPGL